MVRRGNSISVTVVTRRLRKPLFRAAAFGLVLGAVLGTPAQAAPSQAPADQQQVARKDILILPTNVQVPAPDIWNPYIPGTFILQGMNQNLMEPLFMLNYETGGIEGWLASGYTANDAQTELDRKSTRLNSSHSSISYAVFCLKKKKKKQHKLRPNKNRTCNRPSC